MYETRQTTIPFPSRLNDCYNEEKKGSYGPQFLEAYTYGASHIDKSIPQKGKDPGNLYLDDVNNVKVPTTPKIAHSRKKGKPSKKLTILNLVHLFKEGDIEQLLWDFTKGTMQTLRTKNEGNLWKKP
nr:hypothetical protein [Tanacetum cinerariifolium]